MRNGGLGTFTIITGVSSGVSPDIHDRMQVWLQPGQVDDWMAAESDDAMAMLLASAPPHFYGGMPSQPGGEQPSPQRQAAFAVSQLIRSSLEIAEQTDIHAQRASSSTWQRRGSGHQRPWYHQPS